MTRHRLIATLGLLALACVPESTAAEPATVSSEWDRINRRIEAKLNAGAHAEAAFYDELNQLDALLARHWDDGTDEVAEILFRKAELYAGPFNQPEQAIALFHRLKFSFPGTQPAARADARIASLRIRPVEKQESAQVAEAGRRRTRPGEIPEGLALGQRFPDFAVRNLEGRLVSLAAYRGKVVFVDFWASWCPPCLDELPHIKDAYANYHDRGFEIIGINCDLPPDRLKQFVKQHGIAWPQYFDEGSVLRQRFRIRRFPTTFLINREGRIIATDLRGAALSRAVSKAVLAR